MDAESVEAIAKYWALYFPFDKFETASPWVDATRLFRRFFASDPRGKALVKDFDLNRTVQVTFDYASFVLNLSEDLRAFEEVLRDNASTTISCLGLALCSLRSSTLVRSNDVLAPRLRPITPRFINFRPLLPLVQLKADMIGKFISVRGTVVRVCGVRPLVRRMDFECTKCGQIISKDMPDGKYEPPMQCEEGKCKSKTFEPKKETAVTVDFQRIKLQEIIEDETRWNAAGSEDDSATGSGGVVLDTDGGDDRIRSKMAFGEGRVPRTVNIELTDDLVDRCVPGDVIVVSGIVKALNPESIEGRGSRNKGKGRETGLLLLLIEANAVENGGRTTSTGQNDQGAGNEMDGGKSEVIETLTRSDLRAIYTVARDRDFAFLVHSFCPTIFGNVDAKAGLLLGLLGGSTQPETFQTNHVAVRADTHVLIVGDPGMGKSQMLRFASSVAPRGVYVCGNTTSSSGLTVTLAKDAGGEYSLEAGALVLADRGVCCVDEFDKMSNQHNALLEAMEQQSISIAKAGVVCTLCARTSVLAAANPKGGTYRRDRTLFENLSLPAPLLSRFDIVFLLLDKGDERKDEILANHVIGMHKRKKKRSNARSSRDRGAEDDDDDYAADDASTPGPSGRRGSRRSSGGTGGFESASERLADEIAQEESTFKQRLMQQVAVYANEREEPLPPPLLRKYIAYARHYVPVVKLSLPACRRLQRFYLELRQKGRTANSVPITTRQMESMIRLVQARARAELRNVATDADAKDIISLMEEGLLDALTDDHGRVDISRTSGMSQSKLQKLFIEHLKKAVNRRLNAYFSRDELEREARTIGAFNQITDFPDFLERLADHCYLLKKQNGYVVSRSVHGLLQVAATPNAH